jgi:hypothetical protein
VLFIRYILESALNRSYSLIGSFYTKFYSDPYLPCSFDIYVLSIAGFIRFLRFYQPLSARVAKVRSLLNFIVIFTFLTLLIALI